jgi:hypothetical protein
MLLLFKPTQRCQTSLDVAARWQLIRFIRTKPAFENEQLSQLCMEDTTTTQRQLDTNQVAVACECRCYKYRWDSAQEYSQLRVEERGGLKRGLLNSQ